MRHSEVLHTLQNLTSRKPKQRELAEATGLRIAVIGQRACRDSQYSLDELIKLSDYFKVDLVGYSSFGSENFKILPRVEENLKTDDISAIEQITEATKDKTCSIPYYTNAEIDSDIITNPFFTDLILDLQKVINVYGATPDNLRFIAMLGDEMDGGNYPIKNNDLLVIDTSITDLSTTGIYFCKTTSGVFIRRIAQLVADNSVYLSVDNPFYAEILNKKLNMEQLAEVGFTVLGKVIGNESIKL